MRKQLTDRPGYVLKFVRWITLRDGRRIYPPGKAFPIWVKA